MNRIFAFATIILFSVSFLARAEAPDTINVMTSPSTVTISESSDGISLTIKPLDGTATTEINLVNYSSGKAVSTEQNNFTYEEITLGNGGVGVKTHNHWSVTSNGFLIGLVNSMNQPAGYDMRWAKSFEIGWLNTLAVRYSNRSMALSLGFGLDWRNYKTTSATHRMVLDPTSGIATAPYPEGSRPGSSRIKVFSLGFPLLYTQKIPGTTLSITAGGIFNINTHASLFTTYTNQLGNHVEEYSEGISRRKVSFDVFGSLSFWKGCGLYVRYSPQSVLRGAAVPDFHPLSVGIALFL